MKNENLSGRLQASTTRLPGITIFVYSLKRNTVSRRNGHTSGEEQEELFLTDVKEKRDVYLDKSNKLLSLCKEKGKS